MRIRPRALTALSLLVLGLTASVFAPAPSANAETVRRKYSVNITCTSHLQGMWCQPARSIDLKTRKKLIFEFIASAAHCTPVGIAFEVTEKRTGAWTSHQVTAEPGQTTGKVRHPARRGRYHLNVMAKDLPGGCEGALTSWAGKLKIWTSR